MNEKFAQVLKRVMEKESKNLDAILITSNSGSLIPIIPNEVKSDSIVGLDVHLQPIEINLIDINNIECYSQMLFKIWRQKVARK